MNNLIDGRPVFLVKRFKDLRVALNIRISEFKHNKNVSENSQIISVLKWFEEVFADLIFLLNHLFKLSDYACQKIGDFHEQHC